MDKLTRIMCEHQRRAEAADQIAETASRTGQDVSYWRDNARRFYAAARHVAGLIYPAEVLT